MTADQFGASGSVHPPCREAGVVTRASAIAPGKFDDPFAWTCWRANSPEAAHGTSAADAEEEKNAEKNREEASSGVTGFSAGFAPEPVTAEVDDGGPFCTPVYAEATTWSAPEVPSPAVTA